MFVCSIKIMGRALVALWNLDFDSCVFVLNLGVKTSQ